MEPNKRFLAGFEDKELYVILQALCNWSFVTDECRDIQDKLLREVEESREELKSPKQG